MLQIAYFSTASVPQSAEVLHDILSVARARNARDGISGVLVAGGNRYLQVIEGPRAKMNALWSAIRADQRHCAVTQLLRHRVSRPSFDKWSMAFRGDDKVGQFASFPETLKYLTRYVDDDPLRRQIESFARPFIAPRGDPTPAVWDLAF
jgi:hypothetical protein